MAPDQIRVSGTALEVFSYGVGPLVKHSPLCSRGRMRTPTKTLSADDGGAGLHTARPHRLPCHASSPTMNDTGNAAKCNLSKLFTYYSLTACPYSPVWWHHQQWTTLAMLKNTTFPAIYFLLFASFPCLVSSLAMLQNATFPAIYLWLSVHRWWWIDA